MSVQAAVPFSFKGENYFTHTSWFSEKQYNGWASIPSENHNLAFYYSLSAVAFTSIVTDLQLSCSGGTNLSEVSLAVTTGFSLESEEEFSQGISAFWDC